MEKSPSKIPEGAEKQPDDSFREFKAPPRSDLEQPLVLRDGIPLQPQPTSDPLDPLNWPSWKKNAILAMVMSLYFMFTYITTTTVPIFPVIQEQYEISLSQVNWTVAIPALGLAVAPLIWSSIADIIGRRIVFIIGTLIALVATIGVAKAPGYTGYIAARFFQGLGCGPASTVGLAIINDLFFEHERGLRVGLWTLAIDMGLLVGPLLGGFVQLAGAEWVNWLMAIFLGAILIIEIVFLPETLYPRRQMLLRLPHNKDNDAGAVTTGRNEQVADSEHLRRTSTLPFLNFIPVPGIRHPKPWDSILHIFLTFKFLAPALATLIYCFGCYWWILCVITYVPVAYAQYKPEIQGLLFLGLILGTLFSEVCWSGRLGDWLIQKMIKRNEGVRVAEMRLWLIYPALLQTAVGYILWGISIDKDYHWISLSMIAFYSVLLNLSAFVSPFFITPWVNANGFTWCFAAQGIITLIFCVPAFVLLHWQGAKLRAKTGEPDWINPEHGSFD